jgi:hypothetical protein
VSRLRIVVLIGVVILTVLAIHIPITYTDDLNLEQYCQRELGGEKVVMIHFSIFGWRCQKASGQLLELDYNKVCQVQHRLPYAVSDRPDDPQSLKCSQVRVPILPKYLVPPTGGGLNLDAFCRYFLLAGEAKLIRPNDSNGWGCVDENGLFRSINFSFACAWQYWVVTEPINYNNDPNQWVCQPVITEF